MAAKRKRLAARGPAVEIPVAAVSGPNNAPLYTQLYRRLREGILSGSLKPGARLPSARTLAADLRLSRNTVEAAFMQLTAEGFVVRRVGSGTVIAASITERAPFPVQRRPGSRPQPEPPALDGTRSLSARGRLVRQLGLAEIATDDPSGPCAVDVVGFPVRIWHRQLMRRIRSNRGLAFEPAPPQGALALRQAILEHVRLTRGVRADVGQVVIVNSTQQAFDLVARVLLDVGSLAAVEEPGYTAARRALLINGAEVRGIPVDDEGMVVEQLEALGDVRLAYVTPSHQFPLGVTLSLRRRLALLRWAEQTQGWIIEDDYDSEFRYRDRPIAALQGLDRAGRVVYLGTCNKVLFPGLRIGYLIVPAGLADAFAAARRLSDGFSTPLMQLVLADFITGGHFAAYLRQARDHYSSCRDVLVERIERTWGGAVRVGPADTGIHLVAHLPRGRDDAALVRAAPPNGIGVAALSRYYAERVKESGLLLNYAACTPDQAIRSVDALTSRIVGTA